MQDDLNQQGRIKWQNQPNVCMDREHCHHGSSNDRLSDCNHCGAVHWQYNGGRLCEDDCKNCICDDGSQTTIHHCSDCAIHFHRVQLEMCNCNHHGVCPGAEENHWHPKGEPCHCNRGYSDVHCGSCSSGFISVGDSCDECPGGSSNPCSGHGRCSAGTNAAQCSCSVGWQGDSCSTCEPGYVGSNCAECPGGHKNPCSNNGYCSALDSAAVCTCFPMYTGVSCSEQHWNSLSLDVPFKSCADLVYVPRTDPATNCAVHFLVTNIFEILIFARQLECKTITAHVDTLLFTTPHENCEVPYMQYSINVTVYGRRITAINPNITYTIECKHSITFNFVEKDPATKFNMTSSRNLKLNIGILKQGWDYAGDYIAQASFLCARGWALSNDNLHAAKIMAKYLTQVLPLSSSTHQVEIMLQVVPFYAYVNGLSGLPSDVVLVPIFSAEIYQHVSENLVTIAESIYSNYTQLRNQQRTQQDKRKYLQLMLDEQDNLYSTIESTRKLAHSNVVQCNYTLQQLLIEQNNSVLQFNVSRKAFEAGVKKKKEELKEQEVLSIVFGVVGAVLGLVEDIAGLAEVATAEIFNELKYIAALVKAVADIIKFEEDIINDIQKLSAGGSIGPTNFSDYLKAVENASTMSDPSFWDTFRDRAQTSIQQAVKIGVEGSVDFEESMLVLVDVGKAVFNTRLSLIAAQRKEVMLTLKELGFDKSKQAIQKLLNQTDQQIATQTPIMALIHSQYLYAAENLAEMMVNLCQAYIYASLTFNDPESFCTSAIQDFSDITVVSVGLLKLKDEYCLSLKNRIQPLTIDPTPLNLSPQKLSTLNATHHLTFTIPLDDRFCLVTNEGNVAEISCGAAGLGNAAIKSVNSAYWGLANGTCGQYRPGPVNCSLDVTNIVSRLCVGNNSCTIWANSSTFKNLTCFGKKKLYVEAECSNDGLPRISELLLHQDLVRIVGARAWLLGAKSTSKVITLSLTNSQISKDRLNGRQFTFFTSPSPMVFEYDENTLLPITDACLAPNIIDMYYWPTAFTSWTLQVSSDVDLSGVTDVLIQLKGTSIPHVTGMSLIIFHVISSILTNSAYLLNWSLELLYASHIFLIFLENV